MGAVPCTPCGCRAVQPAPGLRCASRVGAVPCLPRGCSDVQPAWVPFCASRGGAVLCSPCGCCDAHPAGVPRCASHLGGTERIQCSPLRPASCLGPRAHPFTAPPQTTKTQTGAPHPPGTPSLQPQTQHNHGSRSPVSPLCLLPAQCHVPQPGRHGAGSWRAGAKGPQHAPVQVTALSCPHHPRTAALPRNIKKQQARSTKASRPPALASSRIAGKRGPNPPAWCVAGGGQRTEKVHLLGYCTFPPCPFLCTSILPPPNPQHLPGWSTPAQSTPCARTMTAPQHPGVSPGGSAPWCLGTPRAPCRSLHFAASPSTQPHAAP